MSIFADEREIVDGHHLSVLVKKYTPESHGKAFYRLLVGHIGPRGGLVNRLDERWVGSVREDAIYEAIDELEGHEPEIESAAEEWDEEGCA